MKQIIFSIGLGIAPIICYSQVGINTTTPKATFDIVGNATDSSKADGLIVPRLTGDDLKAKDGLYLADQTGTMVYVTQGATSTSSKTINVTTAGYYYFNGTLWEKVVTNIPMNSNIYNNDGIIQTNRTVAMADKSIAFTTSTPSINQFSVDGTTLSVDTQNDRIGIGTASPTTKVDINGNLRIGTATSSNGSTNVSTLVRDNTTGEVKVAASSTGNVSPINYIVYTLSNVQGDWISNYDTKVSTADYTMTIVGSSFSDNLSVSSPTTTPSFSPFSVFAYKSGTTWRLKADYSSTSTVTGNGTWTLYCLIINNSILKTLSPVSQDLGGSQTGAAATAPTGL